MSRVLRLLIIALAALSLCAFGSCGRKPDAPDPGVAVTPEAVIVERRVYVPVPAALTKAEPIAEGPINQCFDVAAQRRAALERANGKLKAIGELQGSEARP